MDWTVKSFSELSGRDVYELLRARSRVFVVEQDCPYLDADGQDYDAIHLYQKNDRGQVICYARVLPPDVHFEEASIGRVLVLPEYRGGGLGRSLMERAIQYIEYEWKLGVIKISAQRYLEDFYRSLGFQPEGDPYLEDGIPHIQMFRISGDHAHLSAKIA